MFHLKVLIKIKLNYQIFHYMIYVPKTFKKRRIAPILSETNDRISTLNGITW